MTTARHILMAILAMAGVSVPVASLGDETPVAEPGEIVLTACRDSDVSIESAMVEMRAAGWHTVDASVGLPAYSAQLAEIEMRAKLSEAQFPGHLDPEGVDPKRLGISAESWADFEDRTAMMRGFNTEPRKNDLGEPVSVQYLLAYQTGDPPAVVYLKQVNAVRVFLDCEVLTKKDANPGLVAALAQSPYIRGWKLERGARTNIQKSDWGGAFTVVMLSEHAKQPIDGKLSQYDLFLSVRPIRER